MCIYIYIHTKRSGDFDNRSEGQEIAADQSANTQRNSRFPKKSEATFVLDGSVAKLNGCDARICQDVSESFSFTTEPFQRPRSLYGAKAKRNLTTCYRFNCSLPSFMDISNTIVHRWGSSLR